MPRRLRIDKPGRLHHVINRGQDRQRIFERPADYRFFLSLLVRATRAGRIRLHAYCLMPNHFHLLVESVDGNLSATMQWVQFRYAAYFNRTRAHTGHVFGGRFHSFPVTSRVYLLLLIRYIDRNPWKAKDRDHPLLFPWCSAFHHVRCGPRPRWLERSLIDRFLCGRLGRGADRRAAYTRVFRVAELDPAADQLVELRIAGRSRERDDLDALVLAGPEQLGAWLRRRAEAAGPPVQPLALVDPRSVMRAVDQLSRVEHLCGPRTETGRPRDPRQLVAIGLLRDLVGITYGVASEILRTSTSQLMTRYGLHRAALVEDDAYLGLSARTMHAALACAYGEDVRESARASVGGAGNSGAGGSATRFGRAVMRGKVAVPRTSTDQVGSARER